MQKSQKGFTLIELVVVIVLLGILGVTALGKYQNMAVAARDATLKGLASEVTAGSNINYAASISGLGTATVIEGATPATLVCATIIPLMLTGGLPATYTIAAGSVACGAGGDTDSSCVIGHPDTATTASPTVVCTGG